MDKVNESLNEFFSLLRHDIRYVSCYSKVFPFWLMLLYMLLSFDFQLISVEALVLLLNFLKADFFLYFSQKVLQRIPDYYAGTQYVMV